MESLALMVTIITGCVVFVGGYVGFVIADNVKSLISAVLAALVPAAAIGFFTTVPALGMFWLVGYVLGYIVGVWLNSKR